MIEREFNKERLYNNIVHFYVDKKGYSPDEANRIAQKVVTREINKRRCDTCGHMNHDHIANTKTCLYLDCQCTAFVKMS
ncbi:MAG: hypothetical protein F4W68_03815 [Cenarchaeum sp. SB0661_bin_35]|nr:hypothetical protein [Cenarchaeum sp. SB0661_bin_35]